MRDPLTKADLQAIQARSDSPDVRALLWEIRRLRALVLRSNDLVRILDDRAGNAGMLAMALREAFNNEPVVLEQAKL